MTVAPSDLGYLANSVVNNSLPFFKVRQSNAFIEENSYDFSTIDGDVVTFQDGATAVNSGAGILIGDYFVGITDTYGPLENSSFILY